MTKREFTLKYEFNDFGKLKNTQELYSPEEEYSGVKWKISIRRSYDFLLVGLCANLAVNQVIRADYTTKIFSKNREKSDSESNSVKFEESDDHLDWEVLCDWNTLEDEYLNDGKLEVEIHVKVKKMIGFPREELRSFGEDMQQFSDVILVAGGKKFYVSKLYLSSQSSYFATLFLGQFQESEKTEIELKNVNPQDLQYYLEVIYAEYGINEYTVSRILTIADMYDTLLVVKKCEKFLIKKSGMALKKKLDLAGKFRLEKLKKVCLDQIESRDDIRSVVPKDPSEMDHKTLAELLKKSLAFD